MTIIKGSVPLVVPRHYGLINAHSTSSLTHIGASEGKLSIKALHPDRYNNIIVKFCRAANIF